MENHLPNGTRVRWHRPYYWDRTGMVYHDYTRGTILNYEMAEFPWMEYLIEEDGGRICRVHPVMVEEDKE